MLTCPGTSEATWWQEHLFTAQNDLEAVGLEPKGLGSAVGSSPSGMVLKDLSCHLSGHLEDENLFNFAGWLSSKLLGSPASPPPLPYERREDGSKEFKIADGTTFIVPNLASTLRVGSLCIYGVKYG
jgi:hypothetical protein